MVDGLLDGFDGLVAGERDEGEPGERWVVTAEEGGEN